VRRGLATLEQSRQQLAEHGVSGYFCGSVRNGLADAYLLLAEQAQPAERSAALKQARRACTSALTEAKLDRDALPAAYRLQGTCEWLAEHEQRALDCWKQSLGHAEQLGAQYELGLTYLELGKRRSDGEALARAEMVFDRIHFHPDTRQIQLELGELD
jgi:hypothetical protein